MISKSIITALFLCGAYTVVAYWNLDSAIRPLNQRQGNLVKCQEYVFRDSKNADYVITGSSMAYRLREEFLPSGYYNLAAGGHSSFLGLELVNRSADSPKVVFVEMNTILRSVDTTFVDEIFERPSYDMKRHVVITRDKFQFVSFLVNKVNQSLEASDASDNHAKIDDATLQKRVDLQKKLFCNLPNEQKLESVFAKLKKLVLALQDRNIRVVFFEMPMHTELYHGELLTTLKKKFADEFAPSDFQYIFVTDTAKYTTTDGLHLIASSAKEMAQHLVAEFNQSK